MLNQKKQAFLLLTNKIDTITLDFYQKLQEGIKTNGDLFVLFHQTENILPESLRSYRHYIFSYDSLSELNYIPLEPSLVPGSNHFPVLQFYLDNPQYDYYWCIEDDVRFSGTWDYFFDTAFQSADDFMSCHICTYSECTKWSWWNAFFDISCKLPLIDRVKSLNPIYRISHKALNLVHCSLAKGCFGHHEVLIPTLLYRAGFSIGDFGGDGMFVKPLFKNLFYCDEDSDDGSGVKSTVRWRPIMTEMGELTNKLYHPVKSRTIKVKY